MSYASREHFCETHVAFVEHVGGDVVVVHAFCFGVDAGELLAAAVANRVIAVVRGLTRAFTAVAPIVVALRDVVSDVAPVAGSHVQI